MPNDSKSGPLSQADLLAVWYSAVDSTYGDAFINAGDGNGLEVYNQGFAQSARVSQAIDVTTQACYTLPWSGQTNPSAQGAKFATVTLTFLRTMAMNQPLRLGAGQVYFDEQTTDWGTNGGKTVLTGLRYTLVQDLVVMPGDGGPVTALAVAEHAGYSYNNPLPETIVFIDQPGAAYNNTGASVVVTTTPTLKITLTAADDPDMFVPQHVGQYLQFTDGLNKGVVARITSFGSPNVIFGSSVTLEPLAVIETDDTVVVPFVYGEPLMIVNGGTPVGTGQFVQFTSSTPPMSRVAFVLLTGTFDIGDTLTGQVSASVVTITAIDTFPTFLNELADPLTHLGAAWVILPWNTALGLTVTNDESPAGGVFPMLDGLGYDKDLQRLPGESDVAYAKRMAALADVVTPNAIRRVLNRTLGSTPWCLREVGSPQLPGFFYDNDFYDYDAIVLTGTPTGTFQNGEPVVQIQDGVNVLGKALVQYTGVNTPFVPGQAGTTGIPTGLQLSGIAGIKGQVFKFQTGNVITGKLSGATITPSAIVGGITPGNQWRVYLDYLRFRAYFIVGVPQLDSGDFGFFWGAGNGSFGLANFWDLPTGYTDFYDGSPTTADFLYQQVYNNIEKIRAAGVFWELVVDLTPCV